MPFTLRTIPLGFALGVVLVASPTPGLATLAIVHTAEATATATGFELRLCFQGTATPQVIPLTQSQPWIAYLIDLQPAVPGAVVSPQPIPIGADAFFTLEPLDQTSMRLSITGVDIDPAGVDIANAEPGCLTLSFTQAPELAAPVSPETPAAPMTRTIAPTVGTMVVVETPVPNSTVRFPEDVAIAPSRLACGALAVWPGFYG